MDCDELAEVVERHEWPATRGNGATYLMWDYDPRGGGRLIRLFERHGVGRCIEKRDD